MRRLALLVGALLIACSTIESDYGVESGGALPENRIHPAYESLFPHYVELCVVSPLRKLDEERGGAPGRAVMYLHGACRDRRMGYPQLRACEETGANAGVGVSVNRYFANVNWVAVPERDFFLHGGLATGKTVTEDVFETAIDRAIELGLYEGIELRPYPTDAATPQLRDFVSREAIGTDFAIGFARSSFCTRVPVTPEMLAEIIAFLNDLNREYATGEAEYDWSGLSDNTAHTLHNALAAAAIWKPRSVAAIQLRQAFNLSVPANEFLALALRTADFPIEDFDDVWDDSEAGESLLEFGWLPGHHGALVTNLSAHTPNDVFDTSLHLTLPETARARRAEALLDDERFTDLGANLAWFEERYAKILADREPDEEPVLRGERKRPALLRYYEYIEKQLEHAREERARLN